MMKYPVKNRGFEDCCSVSSFLKKEEDSIGGGKLLNNLARARTKIFEYAICNNFEYFVTLTLNCDRDRHDLSSYIKDLGQMIRNYRRLYDVSIQYLLIPEQHADGAWHMHGLLLGLPESHLRKNENEYMEWPYYTDRFGFMSIDKIKNHLAVSKYITKYISKNMKNTEIEKNKKLYYVSRGLKRPEKIKEGTLYSETAETVPWDFENDYILSAELTAAELKNLLPIL